MPSTPVTLEEVEAPLREARYASVMRLTFRATALIGMALLAAVFIAAAALWKIKAGLLPMLAPGFALALGLTLLSGMIALVVAWKRHHHLAAIANRGQQAFPELGLRLSASLEAPGLAYCPPAIRQSLWRDTLGHLERVPWKQFVGRFRTSLWLLIALMILAFQIALLWPSGRRSLLPAKLARAITPSLNPSPSETTRDPAEPLPPFRAALEIIEPGRDQWATKVEAIPLKVRGESPLGFEKLHLSVSVNGQPPKDLPLDADRLPPSKGEGTGSICLDELEVQDYDTVSYSVTGQASRPEKGPVEITSPIYFVQVRPFQKDIIEKEGGGGG